MSKTAFLTQTDTNYIKKIRQSTQTILSTSKNDWSCQEILRFLALLKVQSKLENIIYQFELNGQQLFDVHYLYQNMSYHFNQTTYFPIMKLIYIVNQINHLEKKQPLGQKIQFNKKQFKKNPFEKENKMKTKMAISNCTSIKADSKNNFENLTKKHSNKDNSTNFFDIQNNSQVDLNVDNDAQEESFSKAKPLQLKGSDIKKLKDELLKIGDTSIIQLSNKQLIKLFESSSIQNFAEFADLIKKLSLDGFILMYLFSQTKLFLPQIQIYISEQSLHTINHIFNLLLPQYIRQNFLQKKVQKLPLSNHIENYQIQFFDLKQNFNQFDNNHSSYIRKSTESFRGSQCGKSQYGQSQYCQSQYGQSEDAVSEYGTSQYGSSLQHNQQYASSQYVNSERGSVRNSMAQSVFGESQNTYQTQDKKNKQDKNIRISSIQDISIVKKLKAAALTLPFNLFNLQPLQFIKISTISYPFSFQFVNKPATHQQMINIILRSVQTTNNQNNMSSSNFISKQFNLTGARFGRYQQNEFRFPDELGISGKHAQIVFLENKYKLVDLGSKMGTFLYIPFTKPLTLVDQNLIQLSNQIQIIVHIIKTEKNEGTIKIQFNKPQNQPFYKASLKNNQTLRIGRSQRCHIKLPHQSLSSKHCQIKYINQSFIIYDCLSTTGTWLRISKKSQKSLGFQVNKGDIIRIASKKTYVIQNIREDINQEQQNQQEQQKQLQKYFQNPNFKQMFKTKSDQKFNQIIQKAWENNKTVKKQYQK